MSHFQRKLGGLGQIYCRVEARALPRLESTLSLNLSLTQLEYVLAVHRHQHFGRAAASCRITQPTLSAQIQKLEHELGESLFDRSKSPIVATSFGDLLANAADEIKNRLRKLEDQLKEESEGPLNGILRLGVIPTVSPYLVPLFLDRMCSDHPSLRLKIDELQTSEILLRLKQDQLDVAILATPLPEPGVFEEVLFYERFKAYLSEDHPLATSNKLAMSSLNDYKDVWLLNEGHCLRNQILHLCKAERESEQVQFESGNIETLKALVRQGKGYTLVPEMAVSSHDEAWVREFEGQVPTREISIVFRRAVLRRKEIRALKEAIRNTLPEGISARRTPEMDVLAL